ncbi:MAG: ABC transporter permease [Bacilli bacterium]|nr:ABC transporter permease [Bacilli bacterium]
MSLFSREVHENHNPRVYLTLVRRHFKVFFKNKISVVFALLVPMITLILYVVFLRQLQVNAIDTNINDILRDLGLPTPASEGIKQHAHLLADGWMLSGIVAVSCISVSLNTCTIMIIDRLNGVSKDFVSSPISRRSINASYVIFNILATFLITFCVLLVSYIYLGAVGGFHIPVGDTFLLLPILLLSVISASLITCFVTSFLTNYNTYNSISVIISSGSGFLIGAFMPVSMLPDIAKNIPLFFPGTYSAGLLRTFCLQGYYDNFRNYLQTVELYDTDQINQITNALNSNLSMNINFFGTEVTPGFMALAIIVFAVFFIILNILFLDRNLRGKLHGKIKIRKKK